jgi:NDP-sugar pyrophosphorylase family protein
MLRMMKEDGGFSIIDAYLRLAAEGERILGFQADDYWWRDLGTPENLQRAEEESKQDRQPTITDRRCVAPDT